MDAKIRGYPVTAGDEIPGDGTVLPFSNFNLTDDIPC